MKRMLKTPCIFILKKREKYQISDSFHSNISSKSPLSSLTQIGHWSTSFVQSVRVKQAERSFSTPNVKINVKSAEDRHMEMSCHND